MGAVDVTMKQGAPKQVISPPLMRNLSSTPLHTEASERDNRHRTFDAICQQTTLHTQDSQGQPVWLRLFSVPDRCLLFLFVEFFTFITIGTQHFMASTE